MFIARRRSATGGQSRKWLKAAIPNYIGVQCPLKTIMDFISKLFGKSKTQPKSAVSLTPRNVAELVDIDEQKYQPVFGKDGLGTMEIASEESELIPWCLVQEIDIGFKDPSIAQRVCFYVTAEFHYDELKLDLAQSEAFLAAMSEHLDDFDGKAAKIALEQLIEDKIGATIYISTYYPDAGIFPKA